MPDTTTSLRQRTLELLKASDLTPLEIAEATGMTQEWARLLRLGRIKRPNVDAIERLYEVLSGERLFKDN